LKRPESSEADCDRDGLLLKYVEDLLGPEERTAVEDHLRKCPQCSRQLGALQETVGTLREFKHAFCPEPWELYEFVNHQIDREGAISRHIRECGSCRDAAEGLLIEAQAQTMPRELSRQVKERLPKSHTIEEAKDRQPVALIERLRERFRLPALAMGAAAAVLLAVLLIPREPPQSVITLSTSTWESVPKPKSARTQGNGVAIIIALKDFPNPLPQNRVDSLYEAVAPTMELYERFPIVSPAQLRHAVKKGLIKPDDKKKMLQGLRAKLGVSIAALVTVSYKPGGMAVDCRLVDTASGDTLSEERASGVSSEALEKRIRWMVNGQLLAHGKRG